MNFFKSGFSGHGGTTPTPTLGVLKKISGALGASRGPLVTFMRSFREIWLVGSEILGLAPPSTSEFRENGSLRQRSYVALQCSELNCCPYNVSQCINALSKWLIADMPVAVRRSACMFSDPCDTVY